MRRPNTLEIFAAALAAGSIIAATLLPDQVGTPLAVGLAVGLCASIAVALARGGRPGRGEVPAAPAEDDAREDRETATEAPREAPAVPVTDESEMSADGEETASGAKGPLSDPDVESLLDAILDVPEEEPGKAAPGFDFLDFGNSLTESQEPLQELKAFVGSVRTLEADGGAPTQFESWLARTLVEAGLLATGGLPPFDVMRVELTGLLYIRLRERSITYASAIRIMRVEAALNAAQFAWEHLPEPLAATEEDLYRHTQSVLNSVCAQFVSTDLGMPSPDDADGEWAVRKAISSAIECARLPYRLTANFRTNVSEGAVAIEIDLTPAIFFPRSAYEDGLGIVSTTGDMRRIAASAYALRLGLLLAACAFRSSERIREVWVAGIVDGPTRRTCYYSKRFVRQEFLALDLAHMDDPVQPYLDAEGNIHLLGPADGSFTYDGYYVHDRAILRKVDQTFSLSDERFCPRRRYEQVGLSSRVLEGPLARALGTSHVSGLAIEEGEPRASLGDDLVRLLGASTEEDVHVLMDIGRGSADPGIRDAVERTVEKLIQGTLPDDDPWAIRDEFVNGGDLAHAVERAHDLLSGAQEFDRARTILEDALRPYERSGAFRDTAHVVYRSFSSYVDRALYNRMRGKDERAILLVPDAYVQAHSLLVACLLANSSDTEGAVRHARRVHELAPMDSAAAANLIGCLMAAGRPEEAEEELRHLQEVAHDPMSIGFSYFQEARIQQERGNHEAAAICLGRVMAYVPQSTPFVGMELAQLAQGNPGLHELVTIGDHADETLKRAGVSEIPTEEVVRLMHECLEASFDAEVFPVARSFANQLAALSGDDVMLGVIRSLEGVPDD